MQVLKQSIPNGQAGKLITPTQVSFMEIYNEVVNDLLSDPKSRPIGGLKVKAGEGGVVFVDGIEAQVKLKCNIYSWGA